MLEAVGAALPAGDVVVTQGWTVDPLADSDALVSGALVGLPGFARSVFAACVSCSCGDNVGICGAGVCGVER